MMKEFIPMKEFQDAKRDFEFSSKQLSISLDLQRLDSISAEEQKRQIAASVERMKSEPDFIEEQYGKAVGEGSCRRDTFFV